MKYFYYNKSWMYTIILMVVLSTLTISCKKEVNQMDFLELITKPAYSISETRATVECVVINGKGDYYVDYGICWSTSPDPTTDSTKSYWSQTSNEQGFASRLIELLPDTVYYARAYASHDGQTLYGNEISFETKGGTIGTVTDIDGNIYNTVIIGDQVWMVENLKTTKYRNGDPITNVTSNTQWLSLTTGAYCYYYNDINNADTYGSLYNWYAVDDSRNIAPEGWHVATDSDWFTLATYLTDLTGQAYIASILKEKGTEHWEKGKHYATNEFGFTALPGGLLGQDGFRNLTQIGYWWSSTDYYPYYPYFWSMSCWHSTVSRNNDFKTTGCSVRCVKD